MNGTPPDSRCHVLFVIGSMGGGGAERQVLEILKRLDRSRFRPVLYLAIKKGELLPEVPEDVPVFAYWDNSAEKWYVRIFRYLKLTRLMRQIYLAKILHAQRIDVIYDRTYLATLDADGGCWFRPTPRISCCVADPGPELELHARFSVNMAWWFAQRAYRKASVVLANSEGLRKRVIDYFRLNPDHVQVFGNLLTNIRGDQSPQAGSDVPAVSTSELHQPVTSNDIGRTDIFADRSQKPFLIMNAGRLHPQKGHRFLLQAIDELVHRRGRELKLIIFGQGETEADLREFIQSHHLESFVTLGGFVADPRHWYQQADLFVLPSSFEGMPNALIEAVACGVPALSTDCPSGPFEILDGGRCGGLVPTDNPDALADGIADAMDHHDEWKARAIVARERVQQMFDPIRITHRLEDLLERVAAKQPVGRIEHS